MAALLDAALNTHDPLTFLDTVVVTFRTIGWHQDCISAAWISHLYAQGEIEALMGLRAAWRRGEDRSPARVTRRLRAPSSLTVTTTASRP